MAREAREKLLSINERDFLLQALREEKRVDGRRPFDMRMLKISVGPAPGEVNVLLGQTRVYCVVSAELSEPRAERPTEGFFHFNTEFSPMASPAFEPGRPPESAIELGRIVERGLRESKAIDTEALCIVAGVKVWSVNINIFVLDHNGNLIDCASIAAVTALLHFRRPEVAVNGDDVTLFKPADREPVPLSIHHIPIAISFALFDAGNIILVDPSLKEELAMDGRITMTMNAHREICAVQKAGGTPLSVAQILQCAKVAAVKVAEVTAAVQTALKSSRDIKIMIKPIDLSEFAPQPSAAGRSQDGNGAKDKEKKKKSGSTAQIFTSEETYFAGGASAWAVKDDGVAAVTQEQAKLSQHASNFLAELAVNLNQTRTGDVDMAEAAGEEATPMAVSEPSKARKKAAKKAAAAAAANDSDEEEETVKAVLKMDEAETQAAVAASKPKKTKAPSESPAVAPAAKPSLASAPAAASSDAGGDLAMALKKKPKKAGASAK